MSPELERVLSRLEGVKRRGSRWIAKCPAHEDAHPSLSIALGDDGRVLLHCFTGCTAQAVADALGLSMRELHHERRGLPRSIYANGRRPWRT